MALNAVWLVVGLLTVSVPLIALALRANIPYPLVLVVGGLVLGFIPGLPSVTLDPSLVLVIFLPPLLYWESVTSPTDVMRANAGQIWPLAIGLVIATTITVACVAHAGIAGFAWPMAFVLGAIVAPTDELAAVPVLERLRMPRHLIAIIEGESLLNDASSLIIYAAAIGAATTGIFSPMKTLGYSIFACVGAVVLGIIAGRVAVFGWRHVKDAQLQGVISFNTPYMTYAFAERFGLSGVLAVVFAGLVTSRYSPIVVLPAARLRNSAFWSNVVFLANAFLFLIVGLQLHGLVQNVLSEYSWGQLLRYAVLVNVTVIGTRFVWILIQEAIPVIGGAAEHEPPDFRHALIAAWSGLRGAVSLAAALAIPTTLGGSGHAAQRDLVIFLTFSVILVTLLGGGLTLPLAIRALRVPADESEEEEDLRRGLALMSTIGLAKIDEFEKAGRLTQAEAELMRVGYKHKRLHADGEAGDERDRVSAHREILDAEREGLIALRQRGEIDNTALRTLERMIDIEEERLDDHE